MKPSSSSDARGCAGLSFAELSGVGLLILGELGSLGIVADGVDGVAGALAACVDCFVGVIAGGGSVGGTYAMASSIFSIHLKISSFVVAR